MKNLKKQFCLGLLVLALALPTIAGAQSEYDRFSLWLGTHYTDFQDYAKKMGEYRKVSDDPFPEFRIDFLRARDRSIYSLKANYFDDENIIGEVGFKNADKLDLNIKYRSQTTQGNQDLLANLAAREWLTDHPGGKILTHELTDVGVDYSTHRQQIESNLGMLLSSKGNIRLMVAHRTILKDGNEQSLGSDHCFSCHITSSEVAVENKTHAFVVGIEGEAKNQKAGYSFGYRKFKSDRSDDLNFYDNAMHPVNGGAQDEFASRLIYEDTSLAVNTLPETKKISHRFKLKGELGKGRYSGGIVYSKVENSAVALNGRTLTSTSFGGRMAYAVKLSPKVRLQTKVSGNRIKNDDPFVDLPLYRNSIDFDYVRYSSLDRKEFDGSAEITSRVNRKTTLSLMAGYDYTLRYDYPDSELGIATKKIIAQLKIKYRPSRKATFKAKYRFEKTSDPFTSENGLFELRGREALMREFSSYNYAFYYQRESLRYQPITTLPTDYHEVDLTGNFQLSNRAGLTVGFKTVMDKNNDLDSLDVKHLSLQPNINLNYSPNNKWAIVGGYSFSFYKSRGPIAVALFDG